MNRRGFLARALGLAAAVMLPELPKVAAVDPWRELDEALLAFWNNHALMPETIIVPQEMMPVISLYAKGGELLYRSVLEDDMITADGVVTVPFPMDEGDRIEVDGFAYGGCIANARET